jgi:hypothetical protein
VSIVRIMVDPGIARTSSWTTFEERLFTAAAHPFPRNTARPMRLARAGLPIDLFNIGARPIARSAEIDWL